jgi:hypothetical protein
MYNFIAVGGTCLDRLIKIDNLVANVCNIIDATSLDHFKEHVDKGFKPIFNGLNNNPTKEFEEYIEYVNDNNIHVLIDAMYEANVMKFHHCHITSPTTLLTANLNMKQHDYFDNVISVPYFVLQSYILFTQEYKVQPISFQEHINSSKKSFLCLNGVNRDSRRYVYDYVQDNNLLDEAIFSFINRMAGEDIIRKYPTILLKDDVPNNDDGVTWDNTFNRNWFLKTYFNLVTESSAKNDASAGPIPLHNFENTFFTTEKTMKPIFNCHPFICIADKNYHANLKQAFDFEMYDEIFDYSFDSISEHEQRFDGVLNQLTNDVDYMSIKEKLEHNQQLFLDHNRHRDILINMLKQIDKT